MSKFINAELESESDTETESRYDTALMTKIKSGSNYEQGHK